VNADRLPVILGRPSFENDGKSNWDRWPHYGRNEVL